MSASGGAPGHTELVAGEVIAPDAKGNGQHSEPHTSDGDAVMQSDDVDEGLSVAGAVERPGTDHPRV